MNRRGFLENVLALAAACGGGALLAKGADAGSKDRAGLRPPGRARRGRVPLALHPVLPLRGRVPQPRAIVALNDETGKDFSRPPGAAEAGTPVIFPRRQGCMLCQGVPGDTLLCTEACPSGALQLVMKTPEDIQAKVRMGTARIDENICYSWNGASCGVCARACPFEGKALKIGWFERPTIDPEFCVGVRLGCEALRGLTDPLPQREGLDVEGERAGADSRVVEDVVEQAHQRLSRELDGVQVLALLRRRLHLLEQLRQPEDAVERRPDLVADARERDRVRGALARSDPTGERGGTDAEGGRSSEGRPRGQRAREE